jgi:hypothetical protein
MNKVYSNAVLTIAAAASEDAYGGLFRSRNPSILAPGYINLPDGVLAMSIGERRDIRCTALPSHMWEAAVHDAPLNQRAWVVQERFLAPRTVSFCEDQIFWECRELEACEVLPNGIPQTFFERPSVGRELRGFKNWEATIASILKTDVGVSRIIGGVLEHVRYSSPYEVWEFALTEFARCGLTKPADKLVAISGIAKEFQRLLQDEYLAGLWRANFLNGLLWYVSADDGPGPFDSSRPAEYRAPSWSWAAVDGPLSTPILDKLTGEYANNLQIKAKAKDADPTAEILDAYVSLEAHLVKIATPVHFNVNAAGYIGVFMPDVEEEMSEVQGDCFCVPLREQYIQEGFHDLFGLVVIRVTPFAPRTAMTAFPDPIYRRIGAFRIDYGEPLHLLAQQKPDDLDNNVKHQWFDRTVERVKLTLI